jgi:hypothetical protein
MNIKYFKNKFSSSVHLLKLQWYTNTKRKQRRNWIEKIDTPFTRQILLKNKHMIKFRELYMSLLRMLDIKILEKRLNLWF